jgi:hypothetical protein
MSRRQHQGRQKTGDQKSHCSNSYAAQVLPTLRRIEGFNPTRGVVWPFRHKASDRALSLGRNSLALSRRRPKCVTLAGATLIPVLTVRGQSRAASVARLQKRTTRTFGLIKVKVLLTISSRKVVPLHSKAAFASVSLKI